MGQGRPCPPVIVSIGRPGEVHWPGAYSQPGTAVKALGERWWAGTHQSSERNRKGGGPVQWGKHQQPAGKQEPNEVEPTYLLRILHHGISCCSVPALSQKQLPECLYAEQEYQHSKQDFTRVLIESLCEPCAEHRSYGSTYAECQSKPLRAKPFLQDISDESNYAYWRFSKGSGSYRASLLIAYD